MAWAWPLPPARRLPHPPQQHRLPPKRLLLPQQLKRLPLRPLLRPKRLPHRKSWLAPSSRPSPTAILPPLTWAVVKPQSLPIDQIVTYKALPEYSEPEFVKKLVADGTLPPVEERLPKEPQVLLSAA